MSAPLPDFVCDLDGELLPLSRARVSVLDRGFLLGDGATGLADGLGHGARSVGVDDQNFHGRVTSQRAQALCVSTAHAPMKTPHQAWRLHQIGEKRTKFVLHVTAG